MSTPAEAVDQLEQLRAELAASQAEVAALTEALAAEKTAHLETMRERDDLWRALAFLHDSATSMPRGSMDTDEQWGNRVGSACGEAFALLERISPPAASLPAGPRVVR